MEPGPQPLPNTSAPPSKKLLASLFILGTTLAIGTLIGTYYIYQGKIQLTSRGVITETSKTPTPNPVTSWKTYTNEEFGFSFDYPALLSEDLGANIPGPYSGDPIKIAMFTDPTTTIPNTDAPFNGFAINAAKLTTTTLKEQVDLDIKFFGEPIIQTPSSSNTKTITIQTESDTKLFYLHNSDTDNIIVFSVLYRDEEFVDTFNQILSTFQFIDHTDTTTWKTYTDKTAGFTFKYPNYLAESITNKETGDITLADKKDELPNVLVTISKQPIIESQIDNLLATLENVKEIQIDLGTKIAGAVPDSEGKVIISIAILTTPNGNPLSISVTDISLETPKSYHIDDLLDKILSTLEFTNETP